MPLESSAKALSCACATLSPDTEPVKNQRHWPFGVLEAVCSCAVPSARTVGRLLSANTTSPAC